LPAFLVGLRLIMVTVEAESYEEGRQRAEEVGQTVFGEGNIRVRRAQ